MNAEFFDVCLKFLAVLCVYPGESLLWLSDGGDWLRDEVHTTNVRDDRG